MKLMVNFEVDWSSTAISNYFMVHHFFDLTLLNNKYGVCGFYFAFTVYELIKILFLLKKNINVHL